MAISLPKPAIATAALAFFLAACSGSGDSTPNGGDSNGGDSNGETPGGSSGASITVAGIAMPDDLEACMGITPGVSRNDIEFSWPAVEGATQYAVRLSKAAKEDDQDLSLYTTMVERLQTEPSIATGERTPGITYRIDAYALDDRAPVCVILGVNMAGGG